MGKLCLNLLAKENIIGVIMNKKRASQFYNSSVKKGIKIIETIANNEKVAIGISEISRLSRLDKSLVYRIINTLCDLGYVTKNKHASYGLSSKFVILTNKMLSKMEIRKIVEPYLKKISNFTNHFTTFSIIEGNKAVLVNKIDGTNTLRIHSEIGKTYPLNCNASGKAYLATLSDKEIDNLYSKIKLVKMTNKSIIDLDKLKVDIEETKKRVYAINNEEHDIYRVSIATPVKNISGKFIGCIGVSLPSVMAKSVMIKKLGNYLNKISTELSTKVV